MSVHARCLVPHRSGPLVSKIVHTPPEVTADKPGVPPLRLQPDTVRRVLSPLPTGRARGTLLTSYELASATFAAGASAGWTAFYTAFAATCVGRES